MYLSSPTMVYAITSSSSRRFYSSAVGFLALVAAISRFADFLALALLAARFAAVCTGMLMQVVRLCFDSQYSLISGLWWHCLNDISCSFVHDIAS